MTNEELILRYQSGDADAANALIEQNVGFIRSIAIENANQYKSLYLDADDYTQEGSLAFLRAAERFDPDKSVPFLGFARRVVENAITDAIRAVYPEAEVVSLNENDAIWKEETEAAGQDASGRISEQLWSPYKTNPERICLQKESLEELHGAISSLSDREKAWVWRRYGFEDDEPHAQAEMAREFGLTESWAKKTEEKALGHIRQKLHRSLI